MGTFEKLPPEERKAISSKGGRASAMSPKHRKFTSEEARLAGMMNKGKRRKKQDANSVDPADRPSIRVLQPGEVSPDSISGSEE